MPPALNVAALLLGLALLAGCNNTAIKPGRYAGEAAMKKNGYDLRLNVSYELYPNGKARKTTTFTMPDAPARDRTPAGGFQDRGVWRAQGKNVVFVAEIVTTRETGSQRWEVVSDQQTYTNTLIIEPNGDLASDEFDDCDAPRVKLTRQHGGAGQRAPGFDPPVRTRPSTANGTLATSLQPGAAQLQPVPGS